MNKRTNERKRESERDRFNVVLQSSFVMKFALKTHEYNCIKHSQLLQCLARNFLRFSCLRFCYTLDGKYFNSFDLLICFL